MSTTVRCAVLEDVAAIHWCIEQSVRELQRGDYAAEQIESALRDVYGVDTTLIVDRTYFVVEVDGVIAASGGWSKRKKLYGGALRSQRDSDFLDPSGDAAKIRAFFVHPAYARRGLGSLLLEWCERAAREHGFTRFEIGATLTGVRLYERRGYAAVDRLDIMLSDGQVIAVVRMVKDSRTSTQGDPDICPRSDSENPR